VIEQKYHAQHAALRNVCRMMDVVQPKGNDGRAEQNCEQISGRERLPESTGKIMNFIFNCFFQLSFTKIILSYWLRRKERKRKFHPVMGAEWNLRLQLTSDFPQTRGQNLGALRRSIGPMGAPNPGREPASRRGIGPMGLHPL
jgi:hypothetical protein